MRLLVVWSICHCEGDRGEIVHRSDYLYYGEGGYGTTILDGDMMWDISGTSAESAYTVASSVTGT